MLPKSQFVVFEPDGKGVPVYYTQDDESGTWDLDEAYKFSSSAAATEVAKIHASHFGCKLYVAEIKMTVIKEIHP